MLKPLFLLAVSSALVALLFDAQRVNAGSVQIITTFDYPKAGTQDTGASGIANNGNLVGGFDFVASDTEAGYERTFRGRFNGPIQFPGSDVSVTFAQKINDSNLVCGTFFTSNNHGFFYNGGTYTQYDYPGSTFTYLFDLNDQGDFVGQSGLPFQSFASIGGNLTAITIADAQLTSATGINNLDQITGAYASLGGYHGFVLDADGTFTGPLDFPGAPNTFPFRLNDNGVVVGSWIDATGTAHGFVLRLPDKFFSYDYPGAAETNLNGVNNAGLITGTYRDTSDRYHAFIARLMP